MSKPYIALGNGLAIISVGMAVNLGAISMAAAITDCGVVTEISQPECSSLLLLYDSTDGENWLSNDGWNVTDTPCDWYGVICDNERITEIELMSNQLTGSLPTDLELPHLQSLYLSDNQITTVPDWSLPLLQVLALDENELSTVPDFFALPLLQTLDLWGNQLIMVPDFSAMPNLWWLDLDNNRLATLPDFSALASLQELSAGSNQLTEVPDFSALPGLLSLSLYNNQLTSVPDFSALPLLQELSLGSNQLTTVPNLSSLPKLRTLLLNSNQLTTVPNFSSLPQLQKLWLYSNQLTEVPDLSALPQLQELDLKKNQLTGSIPDLSGLTALKYLDIQANIVCKDRNINYSSWSVEKTGPWADISWQQQLDIFPYCPNEPPETGATLTLSASQGMAPLTIQLEAGPFSDSDYRWTIDGQTLSEPITSTTFTEVGEHTITLTVTDSEGEITTAQKSVWVWQPGQAIIVGGPRADEALFPYSHEATQRLYRFLKQRGYSDEQVYYLNAAAPDIEKPLGIPESEHLDGSLAAPESELAAAVAQATAQLQTGDKLVFYFHGHARPNQIQLSDYQFSAAQLRDLLATVPSGVQQIIILDSCYSGSFLDELAGVEHRIVITSNNDDGNAWQAVNSSFTDEWIPLLEAGNNIWTAFQAAADIMLNNPTWFGGQQPGLDDDGDGLFLNDGQRAVDVSLGSQSGLPQTSLPLIEIASAVTLSSPLWLKTVPEVDNLHQVRAILRRPSYQLSDYQGVETDFSRIELQLLYNPSTGRYEVSYDGFGTETGTWIVRYQAQDVDGRWLETREQQVTVPPAGSSATVAARFNSSRYTSGDLVRLELVVSGQAVVDLYAAIVFPEGFFMTMTPPLNFSAPNSKLVYLSNVEITEPNSYPIIQDLPLPAGLITGLYFACGVLVVANTDPNDQNNWIHFHCAQSEVY